MTLFQNQYPASDFHIRTISDSSNEFQIHYMEHFDSWVPFSYSGFPENPAVIAGVRENFPETDIIFRLGAFLSGRV